MQGADGIASRAAEGALLQSVQERLDELDTLPAAAFGVVAGTGADQSPALNAAIAAAVLLGKTLILPKGRILCSGGLVIRHALQLRGAGFFATEIVHMPGARQPLWVLDNGVVSGVQIADLLCTGHAADAQHGFYLHAQGIVAPPYQGGLWYARFTRIFLRGFGGKAFWFRGGIGDSGTPGDSSALHQFVSLNDVVVHRGLTPASRALSATGKVGQFYFQGHCEFDGDPSGGPTLAGQNVVFSREFHHADSGRSGDVHDGVDPVTTLPRPGWSIIPQPGGGDSDLHPYSIDFKASVQFSLGGVWIDRGDAVLHECYFEGLLRTLTVTGSGSVVFTGNRLNNAACVNGEPSRTDGWVAAVATGTLLTGGNVVAGRTAATYRRIGSGQISRIAPDGIAIRGTDDRPISADDPALSNASVQLAPVGKVLTIGSATDIFVINPGAAEVAQIASSHGFGDTVDMRSANDDAIAILRLVGGGNITCREIETGEGLTLRRGDAVTLKRVDGYATWMVIARSIAPLTAAAMPARGYFFAGERVRSTASFGAGPVVVGWQRLTTGNRHILGRDWRAIEAIGSAG